MYRKHSFEEKLNLVSKVKNGVPLEGLSVLYNLDRKMLLEWVRKYDLYGEEGLQRQSNVCATGVFKEEVVKAVLEKFLPLPLASLKYGVSRSALKSWLKSVKYGGYAGLHQQNKRGRPPKSMGQTKKREPETELEKLQAENTRLRAENALLKKVKALVEEREARERMSGFKPSKN